MVRIRICGVCWKPLKECLCEDDTGTREPEDTPEDQQDLARAGPGRADQERAPAGQDAGVPGDR